jgi:hypothetical protein
MTISMTYRIETEVRKARKRISIARKPQRLSSRMKDTSTIVMRAPC